MSVPVPVPVEATATTSTKPQQEADEDVQVTSVHAVVHVAAAVDFLASLLSGSLGAYWVFFCPEQSHDGRAPLLFLLAALLLPLMLLEVGEIFCLMTGTAIVGPDDIKTSRITKRTIQLHVGQGLFMGTGMARVLTAQEPTALLRQASIWSMAWVLWTYGVFMCPSTTTTSTKTTQNDHQNIKQPKAMSA
ncbi:expressed unknown protein [Seminavis robusta]|uniref:Uncharacterized protein n=1 Tax=Seminavis robusta TaxID=568900 RepID=A0A9N8EWI1_9STRA|nr:expressed unknown protein [Seminavis robusta]|eukprot:Sro2031_g311860.1 n/a (190) ;mRNA; r:16652-17221